ncbi:MAG: AMP-binding protein [Smithellaceae bacterium]
MSKEYPHLTKSYWAADKSTPLVEKTLAQALREVAAECPDRLALVEGIPDRSKRRRWTYAELLADAEKIAAALLGKFKPGEKIAVWAPNIVEWTLIEYGIAIAGMVMVTVNPLYKARELEYVLKQSEAVGIFVDKEYRGYNMLSVATEVCEKIPAVREVICFSEFNDFMNTGSKSVVFPKTKPSDPLIIMYTSGTTGFQKGALLHNLGIINTAFVSVDRAGMKEGGVWVNSMPMFHCAGCVEVLAGSLMKRGTQVMLPAWDPELFLELMETERGTFSLIVPTMIESILKQPDLKKYDLSSWTNIMTGAAYVEPSLFERAQKELGTEICIVFGQTETTLNVTTTQKGDSYKDLSETIGQPVPQLEVKIADPKTGEILPVGMVGEICARGYQTMICYYNMPEESAKTLKPDGWLHTGDLGTMDERGFLKITGRLKEMIIRGGENVYPQEVEILLRERPEIDNVAVVGVPSEYWGEEVGAVIIPKSFDKLPDPKELDVFCKANITGFKRPRIWYFTKEVPTTHSGKVQKFKLQEMIAKGELKGERT